MADEHPSGNPELIKQHKTIQQKGDQEIAGTGDMRPESQPRKRMHAGDKRPEPEPDTENSGSASTGGSSIGP